MLRIINATPLIYMAKLGKLSLIHQLYPNIITSNEVKKEVLNPNAPEYNALEMAFKQWISVENAHDANLIEKLYRSNRLHLGEASIIALALERNDPNTLLFIDDLAARTIAKSLGLKVSGTLGILIDSTLHSLLSKEETLKLLDQLFLKTPFRISLKLYKHIESTIKNL